MNWRPIETAPLDGTQVLVWIPRGQEVQIAQWWPHDNYWSLDDMRSLPDPTHWMPLPDPPTGVPSGGKVE